MSSILLAGTKLIPPRSAPNPGSESRSGRAPETIAGQWLGAHHLAHLSGEDGFADQVWILDALKISDSIRKRRQRADVEYLRVRHDRGVTLFMSGDIGGKVASCEPRSVALVVAERVLCEQARYVTASQAWRPEKARRRYFQVGRTRNRELLDAAMSRAAERAQKEWGVIFNPYRAVPAERREDWMLLLAATFAQMQAEAGSENVPNSQLVEASLYREFGTLEGAS